MKLKSLSYLLILLIFNACSSSKEQVKEPAPEPEKEVTAKTRAAEDESKIVKVDPVAVRAANQKLADELNEKLTVAVMSGFANAKVKLSAKQEAAWVKKNVERMKNITAALPNALWIEVQGHASSNVAKNPKHAIITRADASLQRAEYAISVLEKNGVDTSKMTPVGKSDTEPVKGSKPTDGVNRRVTFKVVLKD